MIILLFFVTHWYLSLFFQSFFQHRYASHGAFKMSKGWEKVFYVCAFLTQGSSYMSPRGYGIMHRLHHAYTDTDLDPHSPSYSTNIFKMMWRTTKILSAIIKGSYPVEERFKKNVVDWRAFDRFANSDITRLCWMALYTLFYVKYATSPWLYLLLPVQWAMGAFHGAVINWFAHKFGYHNYDLKNTSTNLFSVDILMLGEAYHNNHHKHPSSTNFGIKWHEVDPVYYAIRLFNRLGIIQVPNKKAIDESQMLSTTPITVKEETVHHAQPQETK
jgi:stearoyl-CoA desaturase (delta-9 desaturase)